MKLPFQDQVASGLLSKIDVNAAIHDAISKLDKQEIAKLLVDGFKAEIEHLKAQDPANPGHTYMDEAMQRLGELEKNAEALLELLKAAHVVK